MKKDGYNAFFILLLVVLNEAANALNNSISDDLPLFFKSIALWLFIGAIIMEIISTIYVEKWGTTGETRPVGPQDIFFLGLGIIASGIGGLASNYAVVDSPEPIRKLVSDHGPLLLACLMLVILVIAVALYRKIAAWVGNKGMQRAFLVSLQGLYQQREQQPEIAEVIDPTKSMSDKDRKASTEAALAAIQPKIVRLPTNERIESGSGENSLYSLYVGRDEGEKEKKLKGVLILGEAGAGKTTYLVALALELVRKFLVSPNGAYRFPVIFNLASWGIDMNPLDEWMIDVLASETYRVDRKHAAAWIRKGMVWPLLDGLNEPTWKHFDKCIEAIKAFQRDHQDIPLAICYRTPKRNALDGSDKYSPLGTVEQLNLHTADVQPLDADQNADQIKQFLACGPGLDAVQAALDDDEQLRSAVTTPLILIVLALTYRRAVTPAESDKEREIPRPQGASDTHQDWLRSLWNDYVDEMLRRPRGQDELLPVGINISPQSSLTPAEIKNYRHYLAWLAEQMTKHPGEEFHLEDLQWDWLPLPSEHERPHIKLTGNRKWTSGVLVSALGCVLLFSLIIGIPIWRFVASDRRLGNSLFLGGSYGLGFGLILGLLVLAFFQLGSGVFGFDHKPINPKELRHPGAGVRQSLKNGRAGAIIVGLTYFLGVGLAYGAGIVLVSGWAVAVSRSLVPEIPALGWIIGLIIGLLLAIPSAFLAWDNLGGGAYIRYQKLLRELEAQQAIPSPDFTSFLDDAEDRRLLRRIGGGYTFFHGLLQKHFADEWAESQSTAEGEQPAKSSASPYLPSF